MRAAVATITTFATVLHLAVGCCGHLSHCDGGSVCCGGILEAEVAVECCMEHDHDRESEPASHGLDELELRGIHRVILGSVITYDCDGCACVAKIDQDRVDELAPVVSPFLTSIASEAIVMVQAARGPCDAWEPPVPSELRPPLFERLVV